MWRFFGGGVNSSVFVKRGKSGIFFRGDVDYFGKGDDILVICAKGGGEILWVFPKRLEILGIVAKGGNSEDFCKRG